MKRRRDTPASLESLAREPDVREPDVREPDVRAPRDRGRLAVGMAAVLLVGAAVAADRLSPPLPVAAVPVVPLSPGGVLACPIWFQGNGTAWLHVANVAGEPSKVTVTTVRQGAGNLFRSFTLAPGTATTMTLDPAVRQPAGAIVQFSGGEVVASRATIFRAGPGRRGGVAAACHRGGDRTIIVPSGTTLNADTSVVILNPSTSDAVADISLLVDGEEITPEGLKGIGVKSRQRREIRIGDFAFDAKNVATVLRVRTGVMVADGIVSSERGISISPGGPPVRSATGVAVTGAGPGLLDVVAVGQQDTVSDAALLSPEGLTAFTGLGEALEPLRPQSTSLGDERLAATGVTFSVRDGSAVAASLRWVVQLPNGKGDVSDSEMRAPARRLAAVSGMPGLAAQSRILLGNPTDQDAIVTLRFLTDKGISIVQPQISVQAGRAVSVPIADIKGPFAVIADANVPVAMAISSTVVSSDVASFTVTGQPMPSAVAVRVDGDPRVGVSAR